MITILQGDVVEQLRTLPDQSVHCSVFSPPYWGLRDYSITERFKSKAEADTWSKEQSMKWQREYNSQHISFVPKESTEIRDKEGTVIGWNGHITIETLWGDGWWGQHGLEETPEQYVSHEVTIFREVWRVLRDDGTCWLNMGDCYCGYKGENYGVNPETSNLQSKSTVPKAHDIGSPITSGLKPKDLVGIPWRLAFALQKEGWYLRSDIIWSKPNPMPESVTDRPTKSHEYIFLLTKKARYYYDVDAIREPHKEPWRSTGEIEMMGSGRYIENNINDGFGLQGLKPREYNPAGRNRRTVWEIATQPFPAAHFATFPEALVEPCIKAGTSERGCCKKCGAPWERVMEKGFAEHNGKTLSQYDKGTTANRLALLRQSSREKGQEYQNESKTIGWQPTCTCNAETVPCTVVDPFMGSGTTLKVARDLKRDAIGIELNPAYIKIAKNRLRLNEQLVRE